MILILAVVGLCFALAGAEWFGLISENFGLETGRTLPKARPLP